MSRVIKRGYSFGLEKSRYLELRYFCLQYHLKKQMIHNLLERDAENEQGNAEERGPVRKLKLTKLKEDIHMIDVAARVAGEELSDYILRSVTEDLAYQYLGVVPCGERQFYEYKRCFFKELDKMK